MRVSQKRGPFLGSGMFQGSCLRPGAGDRLKSAAFGLERTAVALGWSSRKGSVAAGTHRRCAGVCCCNTAAGGPVCASSPLGACADLAVCPRVLRGWFGLS